MDVGLKVDYVSVQDQFLAASQIRALLKCVQLRRKRGQFDAARIGSGASLQRRQEVRGDATCWITPPLLPAERRLLRQLESLRLELNARTMLGLFETELHYAWYPPGAGYDRHVDQPHGHAQRRVSVVLYLNEDWTPASGGELRIFDAVGRHRDIEPIAGRLVYFLTTDCEHAVLPTQRDRLSVSGWFRVRD
ncbi:MAG TPA: 2OG-Fe(II) oxygenase [Steroidobacteraceae bacterium]|jgi:SM-20-related protein|nr:2OG-Fe(II) oxygenase [Steroidobacteraceae bacterium]